jgi:ribonuclease HI
MSDQSPSAKLPKVAIYTDGSSIPNPGPGGWGAVLLFDKQSLKELSGSEANTTNNRMELRAAIEALASLDQPHEVDLYTDSKYLRDGITQWLARWEQKNWRTAAKKPVKNKELWQALAKGIKIHRIHWHWVKGHADNRWNERADALAGAAVHRTKLPNGDKHAVHIYTAAAFSKTANRGGWGVVLRYKDHYRVLCGSVASTTANRMHLMAALRGLSAVKKSLPIHLYTYSGYLKDGATRWVKAWSQRSWLTKEGKPVSHQDLWKNIDSVSRTFHISWHVVAKENSPCEIQEAKALAGEAIDDAAAIT